MVEDDQLELATKLEKIAKEKGYNNNIIILIVIIIIIIIIIIKECSYSLPLTSPSLTRSALIIIIIIINK